MGTKQEVISFIGGGNMSTSLIHGLIQSGYDPNNIKASDKHPEKCAKLAERFHIKTSTSNLEIASLGDIIVFAIKPQHAKEVAEELKTLAKKPAPLFISIVTGIKTTEWEVWLGHPAALVRVMPNTPALLQMGASGLYGNLRVSEEQKSLAESILRAVGITVWVNHESDIDSITALSGSGPAYFFLLMEAMQEAGEALGLSSSVSKILTLQTALGAARMGLESEQDLEELRIKVTSKGGTTESALKILEAGGFRDLLIKAVKAAKAKAIEISEQYEKEN